MPGAETPRADCLVADLSPLFFTALLPFRFLSLGRGVFADRLVPKARLPGVPADEAAPPRLSISAIFD